jgi:hypothetical protein
MERKDSAEPGCARAKVSPKPWNWEESHEIGRGHEDSRSGIEGKGDGL